MTAPGWFQAPNDAAGTVRWWDGYRWTHHVRAAVARPASQHPAASIGARVAARAVDLVVLWIIVAAFSMIWMPTALGDRFDTLWSLRPSDLVDASTLVPYTIFATSIAAVFEFFWLITEGATPGKQLVGLYVAELDGDREALAPVPALRRNIHRIVYLVPWLGQIVAIVLVAVSLASMARHDDQRSIMDLAAGTRVRKLPAGSPRWSPWVAVVAMIVVACAALSQAIEWAA